MTVFGGIVLILAICLYGGLYEFSGAIMLILTSALFAWMKKEKRICLQLSTGIIWSIILVLMYMLTAIWAVDSGMAILAFIKYLWIPIGILCYNGYSHQEREKLVGLIPWIGVIMTLISVISYWIPPLKSIMISNGRLLGTFQYANTYGIFLLLCIVLIANRKEIKGIDFGKYIILLAGIGLTGSRTVMVLTVLTIIYLAIRWKNKVFVVMSIGLIALACAVIIIAGGGNSIGRITQLSVTESTFVGRFLYYMDALPLLLKHPFGMGHMGYYYVQNSIQTGLYSIVYVHNDCLQLGLDLGILPMLAYIGLCARAFFSKKLSSTGRLMLGLLFLHGLFDFDLSFSSIMLIMCLLMNEDKWETRQVELKCPSYISASLTASAGLMGAYFAFVLLAEATGNAKLAMDIYPAYTEAKLSILSELEDVDEVDRLADEIIAQNKYSSLAYYAKAMVADCNEDYELVIKYGRLAIENDYLNIEEYDNYMVLLYDGLISEKAGAYDICSEEVLRLPEYMSDAKKKMSKLGGMIDDQPELEVSATLKELIEIIQE